jgi:AcrR family transcriptional regulator
VPKLWTETIDTHRREVHDAIVETTAALVGKHGLAAVTMARIAEETGIGRATLYKYFPDVEAILVAWHERHVTHHLGSLAEARERSADPADRLENVLVAYAVIMYERSRAHRAGDKHPGHRDAEKHAREQHGGASYAHERHSGEIAALVHRTEHVAGVQQRLIDFMRDVVKEAAKAGKVRRDVPPDELARFCLDALAAARDLSSRAAVRRLVAVTLAGLRPVKDRR